jgi:hypothetical protein
MNLDKLNKWLILLSNLGVLVGVVVVAVELQQTQIAMQAEASTLRAQMAIENGNIRIHNFLDELAGKIANGEELSREERVQALDWHNRMLRFFENLHYQRELGLLDDEIWRANLTGIVTQCESPLFNYLLPDWGNSAGASTFRSSFVNLVMASCEKI